MLLVSMRIVGWSCRLAWSDLFSSAAGKDQASIAYLVAA